MSIETILELPVRPGDEARVVELFRELGIFDLAARNEGFLGARLCLPDRAGEQLVVIARWTDEAAIRRWVDDPERVRTNAVLAPHLADEPARRGYTVAVEWPPTPTGGDQP
jgi:heme-degrading monooxygenase HmoA